MHSQIRFFCLGLFLCICLPASSLFAQQKQPYVLAHRGLLMHAPENTSANYRACLELRIGFEFDVRRTKDGVLISFHDQTLKRTTDGRGRVEDLTLEQIQSYDAGVWFDEKFAGQKVMTIDQVMQLISEYRDFDMLFAVDIKVDDTEEELIRLAVKHNVLHRLVFIGKAMFELSVRTKLVSLHPDAQCNVAVDSSEQFPEALSDPVARLVHFRYMPTKEQIEAVHVAGKRTYIGAPVILENSEEKWTLLLENGIDAMLTDYPLELGTLIRSRRATR